MTAYSAPCNGNCGSSRAVPGERDAHGGTRGDSCVSMGRRYFTMAVVHHFCASRLWAQPVYPCRDTGEMRAQCGWVGANRQNPDAGVGLVSGLGLLSAQRALSTAPSALSCARCSLLRVVLHSSQITASMRDDDAGNAAGGLDVPHQPDGPVDLEGPVPHKPHGVSQQHHLQRQRRARQAAADHGHRCAEGVRAGCGRVAGTYAAPHISRATPCVPGLRSRIALKGEVLAREMAPRPDNDLLAWVQQHHSITRLTGTRRCGELADQNPAPHLRARVPTAAVRRRMEWYGRVHVATHQPARRRGPQPDGAYNTKPGVRV